MAEVFPFKACRFREDLNFRWEEIFAPPYDVINKHERERLLSVSQYNVVRLILPQSPDEAARELQRWISEGILTVDDEESILWVKESFEFMGTIYSRSGILCTMKLEDFSSGVVIPHERTIKSHKENRMALMEAVKGNLSPVFGLFDGAHDSIFKALKESDAEHLYSFKLKDKTLRTVFRVCNREVISYVQEVLRPAKVLIADGHHRYETALLYRDRYSTHEWSPENFVLIYLAPAESLGVQVFPTHRVVEFNVKGAALVEELKKVFNVDKCEVPDNEDLMNLPCNVFFVLIDGECWRVRVDSSSSPVRGEVVDDMADINSVVVEKFVLEKILGYSSAGEKGLINYYHTVEEVKEHLDSSPNSLAFLLSPIPVQEVFRIASSGVRFPPKTTYFHPKVPSGVALHLFRFQNYAASSSLKAVAQKD